MRAAELPDRAEWDMLARALNRRGVRHIAPTGAARGRARPLDDAALFDRLWRSTDARLQEASMALLLMRPELSETARAAIAGLNGDIADRAMRRYVAAAALQRMWRTRIGRRVGFGPVIEAAYFDTLGLPPIEQDHGRAALLALADAESARYGYDAWASYSSFADTFLAELDCASGLLGA